MMNEKEQEIQTIVASVMEQVTGTVSISISLEQAKKLIEKIEYKAKQMGVNAVIAVSNAAAHPVAVHCMDNSYIASYDIAFQKAYTAVALKMSTVELKQLSQPGAPLYGIAHTNQGKIVIFGGGEPLIIHERLAGGLGVSGGTEEQDAVLAAYGKKAAQELWKY